MKPSLPRTRGDPPASGCKRIGLTMSPPHPRGSTPHSIGHRIDLRVSPAPAGIHPDLGCAHPGGRGLPRTRGDPPITAFCALFPALSPPHPRGSTIAVALAPRAALVSPAPAGIHPSPTRSSSSRRRLPRTRGDPPAAWSDLTGEFTSPPHPRGSTPIAAPIQSRSSVSPAPAGIHPGIVSVSRRRGRLPRTRGDPPLVLAVRQHDLESPPHPRGSTPHGHR